ncbi:hypothetical protein Scep_007074 [Stephania cephalantha]|uniref:Uncharacterized protein n=1 Tax=Stephania cephalantha TaxID=152367 RepID=A0AAP0K9D2_9MAGN
MALSDDRRCESTNVDDAMEVSGAHIEMQASAFFRLYAGKPSERKWGLPLKGSWGYGNQVKGSGAPTERILGVRRTV